MSNANDEYIDDETEQQQHFDEVYDQIAITLENIQNVSRDYGTSLFDNTTQLEFFSFLTTRYDCQCDDNDDNDNT